MTHEPPQSAASPDDGDGDAEGPVSAAAGAATAAVDAEESDSETYGRILKSSALIGASSVLNVGIGVIRTKIMAVLLGPGGFGLLGLYGSILDLAVSLAGMGVNSSGVRQIAESIATGDADRIARTVTVLRRTALVLGVIGAIALAAFAPLAARVTFGDEKNAWAVALLSIAVFFRLVAAGQSALLQGMRRVGDLARINVFGALLGTIIGVPIIYALRNEGAALWLVGAAAMSLLTSWWFSRSVRIRQPNMTAAEFRAEATPLLKLGFAFMASGFLVLAAAYTVRLILAREVGLEAAGLYSSSWTLGGLYVGYILQSMGTDFYPQLVGVAEDNVKCNRLVNDQAQVSLLLAGPGILGTLTFAPLVIALFYSAKFGGAVEVLRWICVGMAFRVITFPMGFIVVAKGRQTLFLASDFAWTFVNIGLTWLLVGRFGLAGAGMAFCASYIFHGLMTYPIVHWLSDFRWSTSNLRIGLLFLASILIAFGGEYALPPLWAAILGGTLTLASGLYSLRALVSLLSTNRIPRKIRNLLVWLRLAPRPA